MNFLLAPKLVVDESYTGEGNPPSVPAVGEHLIPMFPFNGEEASSTSFISVETARECKLAAVMPMTYDDPEVLVDLLVKQYPGLPPELLKEYVFRIAVQTHFLPVGSVHRVFVNGYTASLQDVGTSKVQMLWENLSTENYI